jgi:hypothetical protein
MDKFKGHGLIIKCKDGYWVVGFLNTSLNMMSLFLEPFRNGIDVNQNKYVHKIRLTTKEQDMIFNKNISPHIKYNYRESYKFYACINVHVSTFFVKLNISLGMPKTSPDFIWNPHVEDNELDIYEYKQVGQYFCRIPKTNKIYLGMKKDDDMYVEIWLLLMELHDTRRQIIWNMLTLERLDVDNYVDIS